MSSDRWSRKVPGGRLAWLSLAGVAALLLAVGLTLTLAQFQALAQPAGSATVESPTAPTAVITSQIRSPNRDDRITSRGSMTVTGIAWREGSSPPYITEDLLLEVERTTDRAYLLNWSPVASATFYLVEEADNPQFNDAETIYFGADTEYPHTQSSNGTFYYRVKGDATGLETSRWSNVVSVTVPWTEGLVSASPAEVTANGPVTVQVRIGEPGGIETQDWETATATGMDWGWEWSYDWPLPEREETQYLIQTRASEGVDGFGSVDTITVTLDNQMYFAYFPVIFNGYPPMPVLNPIPAPQNRSYSVNWEAVDLPVDDYTLQQARRSDFSVVDGTWDTVQTSQQVQNAYCAYYYRVRANNANLWGEGPWSNVRQGQASPPNPPVLNAIEDPDLDNVYTVSWSPVSVGVPGVAVDRYVLQESTEPDFSIVTQQWTTAGTSQSVENESFDTYYYRVRADDLDCWGQGPWSDVQSITAAWSYFDDFSDYQSGWPREWTRTRGALYQVRPYEHPGCGPGEDCKYEDGDGYIIARRAGSEPFARFTPGVEVPSTEYEIEVDTRWFEAQYRATYEIFFSAEEDFDTYYSVKVLIDNPDKPTGEPPQCSFRLYKQEPGGEKILHDWDPKDAINCGVLRCDGGGCGDTSWNRWRITVDDGDIELRVNGTYLGTWSDNNPLGPNRVFGVGATLYEGLTPSKPVFDNWRVQLLP